MEPIYIPYSETGFYSKLIVDYLAEHPALKEFIKYPFSFEEFDRVIQDRKGSLSAQNRQVLADEIQRQYSGIPGNESVSTNIEALKEENTFCIVTAHQLNIFSGPLYVLIKIANTIQLCSQLKQKYPDYHFVPVYMLGSEDHDFDEISSVNIFNRTLTWTNRQQGPMGRYKADGLQDLITEIKQILGNLPFAEDWHQMLVTAYSKSNLSEATRQLVHTLFGNEGLVCVDGNTHTLKQMFIPVLKKELEEGFSYPLTQSNSQKLEKAGYHTQLAGREINLFYVGGGIRERIVKNENGYEVLNSSIRFSIAEIINELEAYPENFSPNAVLRPLYQQTVLPALAYVGGGGELAYWMQLKAVFEAAGVFYPMLILRSSVQLISPQQNDKFQKLGFSAPDTFKDTEALKREYLQRAEAGQENKYGELLEELVKELKQKAGEADPTLAGWAGSEGQKIRGIVEGIEKRIVKAQKAKHETALSQIEKLKDQLLPGGELQERVVNGGQWYAKYGIKFLSHLLSLDPFRKEFTLQDEQVIN